MDEKYIVLDCKGFTGLTVGSYSRKPGYVFYRKEWNFGDDSLANAVKVGRCKPVEQEIKEMKKKEVKTEKPVKDETKDKSVETVENTELSGDIEKPVFQKGFKK